MEGETVLSMETGQAFVQKATDPVVSNVATPGDFAAQYPTPLDPTEILAMCEEITAWQAIPEKRTSLKQETWREMTSLAFTSGSSYIAFSDGACPEEYSHDGSNTTVTLKNIGAKKSLTVSDIMHSAAVAAANWNGINTLVGGAANAMPGEAGMGTFQRQYVADLKEKEVRLGMTLVMNGWDKLLVNGSTSTSSLQFSGIESWETDNSVTFYNNTSGASGTFSAATFDAWLSEGCAKPTHLFGHPVAIQQVLSAYFQLGFAGSQVINVASGDRIVPGFNFAAYVNTGVGRLACVADTNFDKTNAGTYHQATIWAMRMVHNGEPLVYRSTQIPLALRDLTPGCTAISFEIWAKTALVIKHACAHGRYKALFTKGAMSGACSLVG